MIIGNIANIRDYAGMLPHLEAGLELVDRADELELGRHDFDGGYLMVNEGETTPLVDGFFEAHRAWIDVQIMLAGSEEIAWGYTDFLDVIADYNEPDDYLLLDGAREQRLLIEPGMFWVAFPADAHRPGGHTAAPRPYRKIVMKLPVEG